jgi:hypothetical protein
VPVLTQLLPRLRERSRVSADEARWLAHLAEGAARTMAYLADYEVDDADEWGSDEDREANHALLASVVTEAERLG